MDKEPTVTENEIVTSQIEEGSFFKKEWFNAFYKGISLIPQHGDGIRLCLAINTILEDPNMDWEKFSNSELSPKQIDFLARAMSARHKRVGVSLSTQKHVGMFSQEPKKIVGEDRIKDLFTAYIASTREMLLAYIYSVPDNLVGPPEIVIKKFFSDPKNKVNVDILKKILAIIKTSLDKLTTRELLRQYRDEFKDPSKHLKEVWGSDDYRPKFVEILETDVREVFSGKLPKSFKYLIMDRG